MPSFLQLKNCTAVNPSQYCNSAAYNIHLRNPSLGDENFVPEEEKTSIVTALGCAKANRLFHMCRAASESSIFCNAMFKTDYQHTAKKQVS